MDLSVIVNLCIIKDNAKKHYRFFLQNAYSDLLVYFMYDVCTDLCVIVDLCIIRNYDKEKLQILVTKCI